MTAESAAGHGDGDGKPRRFVVHRARAEDAGRLAPLFDAYRQFYGAAPDLTGAHSFIAARLNRAESVVLLARALESASEPAVAIGFAQLYPSFSSISLGAVLVLNDLFVIPSWRRSSVARSLIQHAARHGERVGAVRIHLSTQTTNAPALRLYQSLDFVPDREFTYLSLTLRGPAPGL
jgi:ribosomal protein S18 acetylase RimI-like enzyme